jgi:hypothetical protein
MADTEASRIILQASQDTSKATIKLGPETFSNKNFSNFTLTASAPVSKASDTTLMGGTDGFANAFTLQLSFSQFVVHRRDPEEIISRLDEFKKKIEAGAISKGKSEAEAKALVVGADNIHDYDPADAVTFRELLWDTESSINVWGFGLTGGHQSFSYLSQGSFASMTANKVPYGGNVYWGIIPSHTMELFNFSYEYQKAFLDSKTTAIVGPTTASGISVTKTGPLGLPVDNDKELGALEFRRMFGSIGIDPKVSYDFKGKVWAVDIPIMFLRDSKGNLTGGLDLALDDKSHQFTAGLIIRSGFGIFK